ncbi:unnamed protein product [Chrysodeixis includens]|uniref:Uncharacterized protein n=1 Tax=Chrysodeixis includens TaxID=689277 RepID=A0A9N8L1S9_CHRIL|nr:unnamed protein product [Chrysodeixis includens]
MPSDSADNSEREEWHTDRETRPQPKIMEAWKDTNQCTGNDRGHEEQWMDTPREWNERDRKRRTQNNMDKGNTVEKEITDKAWTDPHCRTRKYLLNLKEMDTAGQSV